MKYIIGFVFAVLFSNTVLATDLCDESCEIILTFPEGGSLQAVEALVITFGSGGGIELGETGTVNTNPQPVTLNYSSGGLLPLAAGDSITFDHGGGLTVGTGGNINYSDMLISSTGDASITAIGGDLSISIEDLTLTGGVHVLINAATISLNGSLTMILGGTLTLVADSSGLVASSCSLHDDSNDLILSSGTIQSVDSCLSISSTLNISSGIITEGSMSDVTLNLDTPVYNGSVGSITFNDITQEILNSLDDGVSLTAQDGSVCTMTEGECISSTGEKYVVEDGQLVPEKNSGGSLGLQHLFLLMLLMILSFKLHGLYHFNRVSKGN